MTVAAVAGGYDAVATDVDGSVQLWSERAGAEWGKDLTSSYYFDPGNRQQAAPPSADLLVPDGTSYPIFGIPQTLGSGHQAGYAMFADISGSWQMLVRNEHGDIVTVDASVGVAGLNGQYPYLFDEARVESGQLITEVYPKILPTYIQGSFPVIQYWKASGDRFEVTDDNILIAKTVSTDIGRTGLGDLLPASGLPDGTWGVWFTGLSENSADQVTIQSIVPGTTEQYTTVGSPKSVGVAKDLEFVIPAYSGGGASYMTAPIWLSLLAGSSDRISPASFGKTYQSPYYVPSDLGVTDMSQVTGYARVTISNAAITKIVIAAGG